MATPFARNLPLDERIKAIRAEIDAFIDARAAATAKECPGVPAASIRTSLTRGTGCQCAVYLEMTKSERKDAA
ncbi:hypothetical protein ACF1BQ_014605 [Bradyrhizobium sp. RDT10]